MAAVFLPLFFLSRVMAGDVSTPSSLLGPRNFNHHASQYHQALDSPETTKQGPVLFPNDGPPPPRPPLIVTSRPLLESIARSELNPDPQNNTIPQSSQINSVVKPFLTRVREYRPFGYVTPVPDYDYGSYGGRGARYEDYEQPTALPPIYKVIGDFAKKSVTKIKQQREKNSYENKVNGPEYYHRRNTNNDNNGDDDDDENKNYAFSYRVKDQKTGDDFSHHQRSSGSATNGEYRVRLPDGRMQIVSYTADENGYQADVRYADDDDAGDKNGNRIDHHNDNHHNYNHNNFNDNHNSIDNSYNDKYEPYNANQYNDYSQNNDKQDYTNNYLTVNRDYKTNDDDKYKSPNTDYYNQYSDTSKEYYNDDFSKEYESKSYDYAPHKSKYTSFLNNNQNIVAPKIAVPKIDYVSRSTVKPSYEELKPLFVTKKAYNTVQSYSKIPVTISVPSTTPGPFEGTTERVVLIGGKKSSFYTNIRNVPLVSTDPVIVTPAPVKFVTSSDFAASPTPMNYLVSTINSLRNNVDLSGPKPVLSNSYIDRINKYLRFN